MKVVIIDYGAGNIQSIKFALERIAINSVLSDNIEVINSADKVIFPGVGEASSALQRLKEKKIDTIIPQLNQPVLGICLGMQLMCNSTEEGHVEGLKIFDTTVKRFNNRLKVPQIGWNQITQLKSGLFSEISEQEYMYLIHSYYVPICRETIAVSTYEAPYSTALKKNNFYGVQFHPEKSSNAGQKILENFLNL